MLVFMKGQWWRVSSLSRLRLEIIFPSKFPSSRFYARLPFLMQLRNIKLVLAILEFTMQEKYFSSTFYDVFDLREVPRFSSRHEIFDHFPRLFLLYYTHSVRLGVGCAKSFTFLRDETRAWLMLIFLEASLYSILCGFMLARACVLIWVLYPRFSTLRCVMHEDGKSCTIKGTDIPSWKFRCSASAHTWRGTAPVLTTRPVHPVLHLLTSIYIFVINIFVLKFFLQIFFSNFKHFF